MTDFQRFLTGLQADPRLGKYVPAATTNTQPETVVLLLTLALADATEGTRQHPAHVLLEKIDSEVKSANFANLDTCEVAR